MEYAYHALNTMGNIGGRSGNARHNTKQGTDHRIAPRVDIQAGVEGWLFNIPREGGAWGWGVMPSFP